MVGILVPQCGVRDECEQQRPQGRCRARCATASSGDAANYAAVMARSVEAERCLHRAVAGQLHHASGAASPPPLRQSATVVRLIPAIRAAVELLPQAKRCRPDTNRVSHK